MHPQIIAFCTSCTRKRCNGEMCDDLKKKIDEIRGDKKSKRRKSAPRKVLPCYGAALHEINGVSHTLWEWAELYGVKYSTVIARRRSGRSLEEALTIPVNKRKAQKMFELNGVKKTLREWCEVYQIKYPTLDARLRAGQSFEEAITKSVKRRQSRAKK